MQIGLFLVTSSVMGIQLLEMRLLSFMLWHHLAYMIISIALLGLGAGGAIVASRSKNILPNWLTWTSVSLVLGSVATVVALAILSRLELDTFQLTPSRLAILITHYLLLSITYICAGIAVALIFTKRIADIGRIYFIDLLGAGTGAILTYFIIEPIGAPRALVLMSSIMALAGTLFTYYAGRKWLFVTSGAITCILALSIMYTDHILDIQAAGTKALADALRTKKGADIVSTKWTPLARIDVFQADELTHPFMENSLATDVPGEIVKMITADGDAQTYMFRRPDVRSDLPAPNRKTLNNYEFSFLLKQAPEVLVIGPGGGNEIFVAHQWGASKVVGVELNRAILDVTLKEYVEFGGHLYESPIASAVVADGRSYLERSDEKFDIIQMSGVDTWAGLSSGAYVLSENYLYTVDAFVNYLQHLQTDGILAVTRFRLWPPRESLRLISLAYPALRELGVENPSDHIMVLTQHPALVTVLIKLSPFTPAEQVMLTDTVNLIGGELFFSPGSDISNLYSDLIYAFSNQEESQFFESYHYDVSPITDDRPFFFEYYKWSNIGQVMSDPGHGGQVGANRPVALVVLGSLFVSVVVLSGILILLPLAIFRLNGLGVRHSPNIIGYFAVVGLAFMFIEIGMMQRFVLFLGHPGYSIPVVLTSLLIAAGLGSLVSKHLSVAGRTRVAFCLIGIPAVLLVVLLSMPTIFDAMLGQTLGIRVAVAVTILFIPGFLMGMPFPLGLSVVSQFGQSVIPWVYGVNSVASVLGAILVILIAMKLGFTVAIVAAAILYAAALALIWPLLSRSPVESSVQSE